jgi:ABC-type transport system involved in multi-copper enzyme maturation permease subunit
MRLLGPVFWYDLVRIARRQKLALWRTLYGLALLVALFLLYTNALPHAWLGGTHIKPADAAAFANQFFAVFSVLQFAAVIFLTPAMTATALAEERGHNTLVFLLTTQLNSREIVLGKLITRFLQIGLLVLTGLPVLGVLQLMGGVEPMLVLATFTALTLTALSLGGLGLACAVIVRKPQNAAWRAYQIVLGYAGLSLLSMWYWDLPVISRFAPPPVWAGRTMPAMIPTPPGSGVATYVATLPPRTSAEIILEGFNSANPYFAFQRLKFQQNLGAYLTDVLPEVLRDYAFGHVAFALLFVGLAVWRLRMVATKQGTGLTYKKAIMLRAAPHPPIKDRPVLWKEIYCESRPRQRWLALFFSRWFFVASFLPAWVVLVLMLDNNFGRLPQYTLLALRYGGTLIVMGLLMRLCVQAARSIGQERDRQTLDNLLTTDLTPDEIVRDKWRGCFLSGRWGLLWLVIHWALGILALALHPLALPLLFLECYVFGMFFVSLGIYFSARYPTTKHAVTAALMVGLVGSSLLPWAGGKLVTAVLPDELWRPAPPSNPWLRAYGQEQVQSWPDEMAAGLTPARVLYNSVFANHYFMIGNNYNYYSREARIEELLEMAPWLLLGLSFYSVAAAVLLRAAAARFRRSVRGAAPPGARRPNRRPTPPALAKSPP